MSNLVPTSAQKWKDRIATQEPELAKVMPSHLRRGEESRRFGRHDPNQLTIEPEVTEVTADSLAGDVPLEIDPETKEIVPPSEMDRE